VRGFVIGVVLTLIVLSAGAYIYLEKGYADIRADTPGPFDSLLGHAMDASAERHAPNVTSPVPDTPENLFAAARVYRTRCIICHGGPDGVHSELGEATSPPAPQFFGDDPPDLKQNENFYIVKNGVRMTAMPAWSKLLNDQQIWQLVQLLKHINDKNVPPEVRQELRQPS
jgi:thiosulfate dehydrogenase